MVQILCEGYHNAENSDIEAGARSRVFKDLLFEKNGYHPVTYADVDESDTQLPLETCLTHPGDLKSKQSLDYIFQLEEIPIKEKGEGVSFRTEVSSIHVEQLFVDHESQDKFTQLSDHYGVTAQVSIHEL
ncbi:Sphingomyelin phosphodiesterase 2, neutral membrane (Neutral sphingomyelinase) [Entomophthora muscae]|uniref:Sphingomyelin phosphodiesterase 2, neutral membrane (Neutral sphingomyelinase) n=1 Tax=Entomophthora muscae TaxID=34485 RepID=A0ACC2SYJ9_9FUNG|nr:Sphingomyelin phosphodiesterase 2, neutral membrane (Neutral sphingomyelinase) [Entomophthora muscae]